MITRAIYMAPLLKFKDSPNTFIKAVIYTNFKQQLM